jgi:hypothetical protein
MTPARHAPNHASPRFFNAGKAVLFFMNLLYDISTNFYNFARNDARRVVMMAFHGALVLFATFTIKAATRSFSTNHSPGSKHQSVACLFLFEITACSYKSTTVERRKFTWVIRNTRRLPRSHFHRHDRHISVISLREQWPALTISPISTKKSSSKLSRPNCLLNNILNLRRNRVIPPLTCGDSCFRAVRGSGSSSSGGRNRPTQLAVVMIMRSVCPE